MITMNARRCNADHISRLLAEPNPIPTVPEADLDAFERYAIIEALRHTKGELRPAAQILNISVRKLQMRLRAWRGDAS